MAGMFKDVSQTVKAGARDIGIVMALGISAAILSAVALTFLSYAAFDALRLAMPEWAAALIIAFVLAIFVAILAVFVRNAAQTIGEAAMPQPEEITPPWAAYGIPAEVPVDRILAQARAAGLSLLGRMTAQYSVRTLLPAMVPVAIGVLGYVAARRVSSRFGRHPLPRETRRG